MGIIVSHCGVGTHTLCVVETDGTAASVSACTDSEISEMPRLGACVLGLIAQILCVSLVCSGSGHVLMREAMSIAYRSITGSMTVVSNNG